MKKEVTLKPLVSIAWATEGIVLDEQREKVSLLVLPKENIRSSFYYFNNDMRVDFDEKGTVELIEVCGGCSSSLRPMLEEISIFEMKVQDVIRILKEKYYVEEQEKGHRYVLPELELALWRTRTEIEVDEFICDMQRDGIETENNEDVEYERKLSRHFETVAIGRKGYFTA